jgi:hypothetical protein
MRTTLLLILSFLITNSIHADEWIGIDSLLWQSPLPARVIVARHITELQTTEKKWHPKPCPECSDNEMNLKYSKIITLFKYDSLGYPVSVTIKNDGKTESYQCSNSYSANGTLLRSELHKGPELLFYVTIAYNSAGLPASYSWYYNEGRLLRKTEHEYDSASRLARSNYFINVGNEMICNRRVTVTHDPSGCITSRQESTPDSHSKDRWNTITWSYSCTASKTLYIVNADTLFALTTVSLPDKSTQTNMRRCTADSALVMKETKDVKRRTIHTCRVSYSGRKPTRACEVVDKRTGLMLLEKEAPGNIFRRAAKRRFHYTGKDV